VARRLNPLFTIEETDYVMYTQFTATLPVSQLSEIVMNLDDDSLSIIGALDVLLTGV
jgi:toxin CcdB